MSADTIAAPVQIVERGFSSSRSDLLAIEEPLQFCLNGFPLSITMRSPGSDLDLAVGFLFTKGIIDEFLMRLRGNGRLVASLDRKRGTKVLRKTSSTRGVLDEEASTKPRVFAADAISYGI